MPITVPFAPASIDFGFLAPRQVALAATVHLVAPDATTVTAGISGAGEFTVVSLTSYVLVSGSPSGTLPKPVGGASPSSGNYLSPVNSVAGGQPLPVTKGQTVEVSVSFTAPASGLQAAPYTATLTISAPDWTPMSVPLTATVAHVETLIRPRRPSTINQRPQPSLDLAQAQGVPAQVPIEIISLAGPDTDVVYSLTTGAPGVTMKPQSFHVLSGQTLLESLVFDIGADAPLGDCTVTVSDSAFGGKQTDSYQISFDINRPGPVTVTLTTPPPSTMRQGQTANAVFTAQLTGRSTDVDIDAEHTLGLNDVAQKVTPAAGASGQMTMPITLAPDAALGPRTVTCRWGAYGGVQKGALTFPMTVVAFGQLTLTPIDDLFLAVGASGSLRLKAVLKGGETVVKFTVTQPAPHITFALQPVPLPANADQELDLPVSVDKNAPLGTLPITLSWTAYDGLASGVVKILATVHVVSSPTNPKSPTGTQILFELKQVTFVNSSYDFAGEDDDLIYPVYSATFPAPGISASGKLVSLDLPPPAGGSYTVTFLRSRANGYDVIETVTVQAGATYRGGASLLKLLGATSTGISVHAATSLPFDPNNPDPLLVTILEVD